MHGELHRVRPDHRRLGRRPGPRSSAPSACRTTSTTCSPATRATPGPAASRTRLLSPVGRREGRDRRRPSTGFGAARCCLMAAINIFVGHLQPDPAAALRRRPRRHRHLRGDPVPPGQALPRRRHQAAAVHLRRARSSSCVLFVGNLYLDIVRPSERSADGSAERRKTRQINVGKVAGRRRRPDQRPVDDHHQDGRRRGHAAADLRPRRRRLRHRPLHVQRTRGGRGPGPDRAAVARCRWWPTSTSSTSWRWRPSRPASHQLRLNPGNIRKPEHIKAVAAEARDRGISTRIGVNAGSPRPRARGAVRATTRRSRWSSRPRRRSATSRTSATTSSRSR